MTILYVIVGVLLVFSGLNLHLIRHAFKDWHSVQRSQMNGAYQVLALTRLRLRVVRSLHLACWLWLLAPRTFANRPSDPVTALGLAVVISGLFAIDVLGDAFERYLIFWFIKQRRR